MRIISGTVCGSRCLARIGVELCRGARVRLQWMDYYQAHDRNAALTCRHFGISRQTFYRWKRRYGSHHLATLEDRSHRPKRLREPTWSRELELAVLHLREQWPRWGKDKLAPLLRQKGWEVSTSMVGRILKRLKERGVLVEPLPNSISARKRQWRRPYAVRKPREYRPTQPGDLVQLDTLDLRPLPGVVLKQFTARDVVSRWDVLAVGTQATAAAATHFLDDLQARMPFPVLAIQIDGGSEWMAPFEQTCQDRGIRLFILPPRSPKLNGCVERANRTHTEEFWECYDGDLDVASARTALLAWEHTYNHIRPHQAPGYLTPQQFLTQRQTKREEVKCH